MLLTVSRAAFGDPADPADRVTFHPTLYSSVSALGAAGLGPMSGRRLPRFQYGISSSSADQVFGGGGIEAALGAKVRADLAVALDVAAFGTFTTESSHDTSPDLTSSAMITERALVLAGWSAHGPLDLRAGLGFEHMSFVVPIDDSNVAELASYDGRTVTAANGPALVVGAGLLFGKAGQVHANVGIDLSAAYLVSDVEIFLPLSATLHAGVTTL